MKNALQRYIDFGSMRLSHWLFLAAALLLVYIVTSSMKAIVVLLLLTVAGSLSTIYYHYFHGPVNFELVKLSTVLAAVAYGMIPALFVGIAATMFSRLLSGRMDATLIVSIAGIAVMAVLAAVFNSMNIVWLGIALVLLYHLLTAPLQLMMGGSLGYGAMFVGTNILFNVILFSRVAPILLAVIK